MTTPKGTRAKVVGLATGDQVHLYSDKKRIVLQLRRAVPTESNVLAPSFKVAVKLAPAEALALATELMTVAAGRVVEKPA